MENIEQVNLKEMAEEILDLCNKDDIAEAVEEYAEISGLTFKQTNELYNIVSSMVYEK